MCGAAEKILEFEGRFLRRHVASGCKEPILYRASIDKLKLILRAPSSGRASRVFL